MYKKIQSEINKLIEILINYSKTTYTLYVKYFYTSKQYSKLGVIVAIVSVLFIIVIARLLGPVEYGKYSLISQLVLSIGLVFTFGFNDAKEKYLPEINDENGKAAFFTKAVESILVLSAMLGIIYFMLIILFGNIIPEEIRSIKYAFLLFIVFYAVLNVALSTVFSMGILNQKHDFNGYQEITGRLLSIILLIFIARRYQVVFYVSFTILVILTFMAIYLLRRHIAPVKIKELKPDPGVKDYCLIIITVQLVYAFITVVDSALIRLLLRDAYKVGIFNAGVFFPRLIETTAISIFAMPFLKYMSKNDIKYQELSLRVLSVCSGIIGLIIFSFADKIILIFYSQSYFASIKIMRYYSFVLFFLGIGILNISFSNSINKPYLSVISIIGYVSVIFIGDIMFIPVMKVTGAVISSFIGHLILAICTFIVLIKNEIKIDKRIYILFLGMILSVFVGYLTKPYFSIPFFILFIVVEKIMNINNIEEIKLIKMKILYDK